MNRAVFLVIAAVVILISVLAIHAYVQPKPFRWNETYHERDKQPYGGYVIRRLVDDVFPGRRIQNADNETFSEYHYWIGEENSDYLFAMDTSFKEEFNFIAVDDRFSITDIDSRSLILHVFQGNHALLAFNSIDGILLDELEVETNLEYSKGEYLSETGHFEPFNEEKFHVDFFNSQNQLKPVSWLSTITSYPENARVIGRNEEGDVIGITIEKGKGSITFLSMPLVFSNYSVLKSAPEISENLLKSLPNRDTYWASGYWSWQTNYSDSPSFLSFIHSNESLTWALYTLLFSVLLFFVFELKRQQRPVPEKEPVENVSLKFSESLSRLYLIKKDHRGILRKKMSYLLEMIRNDYMLSTNEFNENFFVKLSHKSGVPIEKIRELFMLYAAYQNISELSTEQFMKFNRLIQLFKRNK